MTLALHGYPDWQRKLATADLQVTAQSTSLATLTSIQTAILDVRAYSSFVLRVNAQMVPVPVAWGHIYISVEWFADAAGTLIVHQDTYRTIPSSNAGTAFDNAAFDLSVGDAIRGPYVQVTEYNAGPQTVAAEIVFLGTSRQLGRRYLRQNQQDASGVFRETSGPLLSTGTVLGAGVAVTLPIRCTNGAALLTLDTGAGGTYLYSLSTPDGRGLYRQNVAAGSYTPVTIQIPDTASLFMAQNTGAAPNNFIAIFSQDGRDG